MNETIISALISTIVPSLITIIGFIVTYNMNVKNYKEELQNHTLKYSFIWKYRFN